MFFLIICIHSKVNWSFKLVILNQKYALESLGSLCENRLRVLSFFFFFILVLFEATHFEVICYGSKRKLTRVQKALVLFSRKKVFLLNTSFDPWWTLGSDSIPFCICGNWGTALWNDSCQWSCSYLVSQPALGLRPAIPSHSLTHKLAQTEESCTQSTDSGARLPVFKCWLCPLQPVGWSQSSIVILSFSQLIRIREVLSATVTPGFRAGG